MAWQPGEAVVVGQRSSGDGDLEGGQGLPNTNDDIVNDAGSSGTA
jgi:hypothetical protein